MLRWLIVALLALSISPAAYAGASTTEAKDESATSSDEKSDSATSEESDEDEERTDGLDTNTNDDFMDDVVWDEDEEEF